MDIKSKPDPFKLDDATAPLTDEEVKKLRPAADVFAEKNIKLPPKPRKQ
ncbi:hypothetical protein [uncultured Sneathiella sp.]|nr:hypothetical protein [uncultured Sneathiella sp.]